VRQTGEMIGKLGRDQRSGVRGQKRKDLRRRWRGCLGGGGLDTGGRGWRGWKVSRKSSANVINCLMAVADNSAGLLGAVESELELDREVGLDRRVQAARPSGSLTMRYDVESRVTSECT
jgi:hypothetical protein